jgi:hypothetical protein
MLGVIFETLQCCHHRFHGSQFVVGRVRLHLVVLDPARVARATQGNFPRYALDLFLDGDQLSLCLCLPDGVDSRRDDYVIIAVVATPSVIYWLGIVPELGVEFVSAVVEGERHLADRANYGFSHELMSSN